MPDLCRDCVYITYVLLSVDGKIVLTMLSLYLVFF
jgi:hypothetical protein